VGTEYTDGSKPTTRLFTTAGVYSGGGLQVVGVVGKRPARFAEQLRSDGTKSFARTWQRRDGTGITGSMDVPTRLADHIGRVRVVFQRPLRLPRSLSDSGRGMLGATP
jgi:hypothetical protein